MVGLLLFCNQCVFFLSGDIIYIDQVIGQDGFKFVYLVNLNIVDLLVDIQDIWQIINSVYFVDFFMMLQNINICLMLVEVVIEMKEEKLLMFGFVFECLNDECLNLFIDCIFFIMVRKNFFLFLLDVLQGMLLCIEYILVMVQVQKFIGLLSLLFIVGFIGQLVQVKLEVLDKFNVD